ncbi:AMP-binding enzyme, partial [Bacillus sp. B-TM1]
EYMSRADHQIKIRGFRIELAEIEMVIQRHENVKQAVVMVREDHPNDKRIIAYIVAEEKGTIHLTEIRSYVSESLANYMVPAALLLGAGRATKESEIDLAVGLMLRKKVGESVKKGESLVTIYANRENVEDVKAKIYENMKISKEHVDAPTLVHGIVTE